MLEHLLGGQPALWIKGEELLHQVNGLWWSVGDQLGQRLSFDLWCLFLHVLKVLLTPDLLLYLLIWQPEHLDQVLKVLLRSVGADEHFLGEELCYGAANRPHVN